MTEFEDIDYREDEALSHLSPEELNTFNTNTELYIQNPDNSKSIWYLVDSIIELEDSIKDIKGTFYENFDKLILESKSKLESALKITKDITIKALIEEAISKINDCLQRLNIPSQSLSDKSVLLDNKDILLEASGKLDIARQFTTDKDVLNSLKIIIEKIHSSVEGSPSKEDVLSVKSMIEKLKEENTNPDVTTLFNETLEILSEESTDKIQRYSKHKYSYPYFKYKKGTQLDKESTEIGKRFAKHLKDKSNPHYDSRNRTDEELHSLIDSLDLKEEEPDPSITAVIDSALERLKERKLEFLYKKKELVELSNAKTELSNKKSSLAEFRKTLLDSCILNMIDQAKEE
jgi:hypothetical protein